MDGVLLAVIAGLSLPAAGSLHIAGLSPLEARRTRQDLAFVFQDATLLPWRTVEQNVALPGEFGRLEGLHAWFRECLLKAHHELATFRNAAFSQPYYVRHDYAHLRRGEAAAFISAGRASHANSSMMREKDETTAVKHPELLDLIFDPHSFL